VPDAPSSSRRPRHAAPGPTSLLDLRLLRRSLGGLLLVGAALGACSSSPSASTASTATTSTSSTTATSPTTAASAGTTPGPSASAQIQSLSAAVRTGQHATFKATYRAHNPGGTSESVTVEQMPPRSVFSAGTSSVLDDGTRTYFCSPSGGSEQCVSEAVSGSGTSPLASITAVFDPATVLNEFRAAEAAVVAHSAGSRVAFSHATYAGLAATCVDVTHESTTVTYCVTNSGVLAYASTAGSTFELTAFSSSPPASDFTLPAGATVITVPPLGTTP
jgi:hypothetical protein